MKIKTTKGHLTATEKRHLKAIFNANLTQARVNTKEYYLNANGTPNTFKVEIRERYEATIGAGVQWHKNFAEFKRV